MAFLGWRPHPVIALPEAVDVCGVNGCHFSIPPVLSGLPLLGKKQGLGNETNPQALDPLTSEAGTSKGKWFAGYTTAAREEGDKGREGITLGREEASGSSLQIRAGAGQRYLQGQPQQLGHHIPAENMGAVGG